MSQPVRLAINGMGRIGRQAFKACLGVTEDSRMQLSSRINLDEIELVAVNDLTDARITAHLLKYDSVYGRYHKEILVEHNGEIIDWEGKTSGEDHDLDLTAGETYLVVNGKRIRMFSEPDPAKIPWGEVGVDTVMESTGVFESYEKAKKHLEGGAKRVVISAPAKGEEDTEGKTLVFGTDAVDDSMGDFEVISNASCTTNCASPVMQVLQSKFGVEKAFLTTVHGYTATQTLVDGPNDDLRRARAAAENIVPTTTGAAKTTAKAIPALKDKFDGISMRVPVPAGSISDITAILSKDVTIQEVNEAFIEMSKHPMYAGVLEVSKEPIVSMDIVGNPASAIVDLEFTNVIGGNFIKVLAWYDNEWGYSNRLVEMAVETAKAASGTSPA